MTKLAVDSNDLNLPVRWGILDKISLLLVSYNSLIEVVTSSYLLSYFLWVSSNVDVVDGILYVNFKFIHLRHLLQILLFTHEPLQW
jgi:hypothetical protein